MTPLLLLAASLAADPAPGWRFVDEAARDGRSMLTYRAVELGDAPAVPPHAADKPPAGSRFGSVALGSGGRRRLGVVWHAASSALWLDADGDGRFAPAERHTLTAKPVEVEVAVPSAGGDLPRTLLVRKRGDGVAWAVRGYTAGTVAVGGKDVAALLTDGDADGCFDGAGVDRVWLDLDGDGKFDPLTEQFLLGNAVTAGGTAFLVKPRADGLGASARERPAAIGTLRVDVNPLPGAEVVELRADYAGEFGELVPVRAAGTPVELPAGKYRVEKLTLKLLAADGRLWHYSFWSPGGKYDLEVVKGRRTDHAPLDGLKVLIGVEGAAVPGAAVRVQPSVAAGTLFLSRCEVGPPAAEEGRGVTADVRLAAPGSATLDRCDSAFH